MTAKIHIDLLTLKGQVALAESKGRYTLHEMKIRITEDSSSQLADNAESLAKAISCLKEAGELLSKIKIE